MSGELVHWHSQSSGVSIVGATHQGLCRDNNEDNFAAAADQGIVLVADGIGGHSAGEMAAAIATHETFTALRQQVDGNQAIANAHQHICYHAQHDVRLKNMGATVVCATLRPAEFTIHWLGDSRAYLLPKDNTQLIQLTTDHTLWEQLRQQGQDVDNSSAKRQYGHILTSALGASQFQPNHIEQMNHPWQSGDILILCSDGLSDMLSGNQISNLIVTAKTTAIALERLLQASLAAGGHDNITIVVAQNHSDH
ncbi:protein phosphatase [Neiella marina]|uniref:Protein phosphatase n=1 Tax=Neiella marina TaxID=508461 RepID=A0A8J2U6G6_9GAMM|nr:protein phosphatase 2C domain-containing protein [Neiella marina]GGA81955.1 protein phosphatase [Neiella marina]